ncbi:MAG: ABC transporter permease [Clostridiales bacterium]|nr:ABC transporter permease [Clostridiales bacterium]HBM79719.1 diguanylate cyclase [Clostridiaceae bacterium]
MTDIDRDKFKIIGCENADADIIVRPNITFWQDAWRRLKKNKVATFSMYLLLLIILLCIIGPHLTKYSYRAQNMQIPNRMPFGDHWFGTDNLGRDMFARTWMAGRVSITIGIVGTLIEILVGSMYGGISGYFGGLVDDIMMRIVEIIVSIPYMIVVILVSLVLGRGMGALIIALCITGWTGIARIIRGQIMQLKESEYVLAAQALGANPMRIIMKHLIPNTIGLIIVYVSFDIPSFIFGEAFLSFIGLGIQSPKTSWGAMASSGQANFRFYPYQLLIPSLAISLTMLSFNLLGDGLRDALDPRLRQ